MSRPLAIDLFCGLGGWAEGLLAEGWDVVGFDIERHEYGAHRYQAQLVLQDVLTLHGSQFRDAALIVASPPCQFFSYCAMPWTRAKALAVEVRADPAQLDAELALFRACFRIQAEASETAGQHIPLVVENVRGAQPWVGRAKANFGSFYLWGDVPTPQLELIPGEGPRQSLLPSKYNRVAMKGEITGRPGCSNFHPENYPVKIGGGAKVEGIGWTGFADTGASWRNREGGVKHHGSGAIWFDAGPAVLPSSSPLRKMASAMIARIPLPLARHIATVYRPAA